MKDANKIFDEIKLYLPKNLTDKATQDLFEELKKFPNINGSRFYIQPDENEVIYQGDGIRNLLAINLPKPDIKEIPAMVISNTCDIDIRNRRRTDGNIIYSPIINLEKYIKLLKANNKYDENHIKDIKKQRTTNIFYLPKGSGLENESIVFFDRVSSCDNDFIDRKKLQKVRIFTLSLYGHYLFLLKLSIHFTRLEEEDSRDDTKTR